VVVIQAFQNHFLHFAGAFFGIKISVVMSRQVMKKIGRDGILLD
jgi:hypothetical protein